MEEEEKVSLFTIVSSAAQEAIKLGTRNYARETQAQQRSDYNPNKHSSALRVSEALTNQYKTIAQKLKHNNHSIMSFESAYQHASMRMLQDVEARPTNDRPLDAIPTLENAVNAMLNGVKRAFTELSRSSGNELGRR